MVLAAGGRPGTHVHVDGSEVEVGHRSMRLYYRQSYRPNHGSPLGHIQGSPELQSLMLQYAKAGVLAHPMGGQLRHGKATPHHERTHTQLQRDKKAFVAQGITNNMTMKGMKHFKNQSLNF